MKLYLGKSTCSQETDNLVYIKRLKSQFWYLNINCRVKGHKTFQAYSSMVKIGSQAYIQNLQFDISTMKPDMSPVTDQTGSQENDNLGLQLTV